jgi:hypothetical protein
VPPLSRIEARGTDMDLPVRYEHGGGVVTGIKLIRPRGIVLAETRKIAEGGDIYNALATFISGSTEELEMESGEAIDDKARIRSAVRDMPYEDGNWSAIQILLLLGTNSEIDGVWRCPRCRHRFFSDPDNPDLIEDLATVGSDSVVMITQNLRYPVEIKNAKTGEAVVSVDSVTIRLPSMGDCSRAYRQVGGGDRGRLQFAIYSQATVAVNGQDVDDKWRGQWGSTVFERMDAGDLSEISRESSRYGLNETLPKRCPECSKEWDAPVDVSGFFADGLRGE